MLNEAQISLTGYVATQPVTRTLNDGTLTVSMRVAWTPRRQDRVTGEWVDCNTSYVTVICWRRLASNVAICVRKGDAVVVKGRLSVRSYDKDGATRIVVEVDANSVGHDLSRGVAQFQRVRPPTGMTASEFAAARPEDSAEAGDRAGRAGGIGEAGDGGLGSGAVVGDAGGGTPGEDADEGLIVAADDPDSVIAPF
jgi:single-strand DNA-binding protein